MFKEFLKRLFHIHKFELTDYKEIPVYNSFSNSNLRTYTKFIYVLKCSECGKIKFKKIKS